MCYNSINIQEWRLKMTEFLTEQLIKRKMTIVTTIKKVFLILMAIVSLSLGMVHPMLVWVSVIIIIVDIILFKRMNVEYEYIYYNGDLDIDRILDKQSRKRIFSTNIKDMEVIAPTGSIELQQYQRVKELDYSSRDPEHKTYEMVTKFKGDMVRVVFEPNEKILTGMKSMAPRKVYI